MNPETLSKTLGLIEGFCMTIAFVLVIVGWVWVWRPRPGSPDDRSKKLRKKSTRRDSRGTSPG